MTFQAYLDNIREKTGKSPKDFYALAQKKGLAGPAVTATQLIDWLKNDFALGHGHAMAIWAVFKANGWAADPAKTKTSPKPKARQK